jgi:hypothetical protein
VNDSAVWHNIRIDSGQLILSATLAALSNQPKPVVICTGLNLASSHELKLENLQIQTELGLPLENLDSFKLDLGPEVAIEELTLTPGQLVCRGHINVLPSEEEGERGREGDGVRR